MAHYGIERDSSARKAISYMICDRCGVKYSARGRCRNAKKNFCSTACRYPNMKPPMDPGLKTEVMVLRKWGAGHHLGYSKQRFQRWSQRARSKCVTCGAPVGVERTKIYPAKTCSQKCAKQTEQNKAAKRKAKSRRRARKRGARKCETLDPIAVLERGDWVCYICGIETPKELRGTCEPNAPEVDHIVPVSAGGEHSFNNTACACRSCNNAKASMSLEEMIASGGGTFEVSSLQAGHHRPNTIKT